MRNRVEAQYLDKPYREATLREHREAREHPIHRALRLFLGVDESQVDQHESQHPTYDLPHLHHAIAACFPEWTLEEEMSTERRHGFGGAACARWEIAPNEWADYVDNGNLLYRLPDGSPRIVRFAGPYGARRGDMYEMSVITRRQDRKAVNREPAKFQKWLGENHYLKGRAIRPNGTLLPKSALMS